MRPLRGRGILSLSGNGGLRPPFLFLPAGEKETRISALRAALRAVALRNAAAVVLLFSLLLRNALGVLLVVDFCRLVTKLHTER